MRRITFIASLTALAAFLGGGVYARSASLKLGDKPPRLDVARWVGAVPRASTPTKIRIVTFFSSWSSPSRQALPVLEKVAKKHRSIVALEAVSVYEKTSGPGDTAYFQTVSAFVKEMGARMPYPVGIDGPGGKVAAAWLDAAGESGVPTSFIVGRNGKIVWIGHTIMLDSVLDQIVARTFDFKRYAEERAAQQAEEARERKLFARFNALQQAGRHKEAVAELDRIAKAQPDYGRRMVLVRFSLLLKADEKAAYAYGRELLNGELKDQSGMLWLMARMLLDETPGLQAPDYKLALDLSQRSAELTKHQDANILTALAFAHFKLGHVDEAISLQERAIPIGDANPQIPDRNKQLMRTRLETFKKAKSR